MLQKTTGDLRNQRIGSLAFVCGAEHPKRTVSGEVMMSDRYSQTEKKVLFFHYLIQLGYRPLKLQYPAVS